MSRLTAVGSRSLQRSREARLRSRGYQEKNTCTIDARIPPYMGSVSATTYVPLLGKYLTKGGVTCCWDTTTAQWLCSGAALNIRVKCGSESEPARPPKLGFFGLKVFAPQVGLARSLLIIHYFVTTDTDTRSHACVSAARRGLLMSMGVVITKHGLHSTNLSR